MKTKEIQDVITEIKPNCTQKQREEYGNLLTRLLAGEVIPLETLNVRPEMLEYLYGHAYRMFTAGQYKNAAVLFSFLIVLNSANFKHHMALGACFHRMGQHVEAMNQYMAAFFLNPDNPLPFYHISDCYIKLKKLDYAAFSLGMAIALAGNDPQYLKIKERAELTQATLLNQLKEKA